MSKKNIDRFAAAQSGRVRISLPGTEKIDPKERHFAAYEHVHTEYLSHAQYLNPLLEHYKGQLEAAVDSYSHDEWCTPSVTEFGQMVVTRCAVQTLVGPNIFDLNPGFLDLLWDFDKFIFPLAMGLPKWIYTRPNRAHQRYLAAFNEYLNQAWERLDWDDVESAAFYWEPNFDAQISREIVKWLQKK